MNDYRRIVLQKHSTSILDDVQDPTDIVASLISENVLLPEDWTTINNSPKKTAKFLEILLGKEGPWLETFAEVLSSDFEWLATSLQNDFYDAQDQKFTFYLSGRGNVPPLPQHHVTRKKFTDPLRNKIRDLKRNSYLVVHGMSGCGKTSLVVDALHDMDLLEKSLNGYVYWLSVGDDKNKDPDELQCRQLQKKLFDMVHPSSTEPKDDLLYGLKQAFSMWPNMNALLVLHEVTSHKVIKSLSVGCKTLVITQDCDVMKDYRNKQLFPVDEGFTESETVEVLERFVVDGPGHLSPHIKDSAIKIHQTWRGHPMVIGLIGGDLSDMKQESQKNQSRWKEYERNLSYGKNDDEVPRRRSLVHEQMTAIIELMMNKLSQDYKTKYKTLAVFVEDTNISADVLKILWGLDESEVRLIMNYFYKRSLVFRNYNSNLEMTIYGIHDILMGHLKKKLSSSDLEKMHQDLLSKYFKASNGNFSKLPEDNYIYSYLCHHIEKANKWDEYREQLFSLPYIRSKLKATGPGDLLLDLRKYYVGLVGNKNELHSRVEDIKKFVENCGWDVHKSNIDIVQCGLLEPCNSYVKSLALEAASNENFGKVYFCSVNTSMELPKEVENRAKNVRAVSIITRSTPNLSDGRVLIYPDENLHIAEIDMNYEKKRRSFKVDSEVVLLKTAPLSEKFLSASVSGCINVWNLNSNPSPNANTPPPSIKQKEYLPYFSDIRHTPTFSFSLPRLITCANFSNSGRLIVAASTDGTVCVWNLEETIEEFRHNVHPSPYAVSCSFVCDDAIIVYCCQNFQIHFYELQTKQEICCFSARKSFGNILSVLCLQELEHARKFILVQEKAVLLYSWDDQVLQHRIEGPRDTNLTNFTYKLLHEERLIKCAVYSKLSLLIGTTQGCCLYFNIFDTDAEPVRISPVEIKAVDMAANQIVYAQHDAIKMCWPEPGNKVSSSHQPSCAHLGWTSRDASVYATATDNGILQVKHDGMMVADRFCSGVCIVHVSSHGNHVLLGTNDGQVCLFDVVSKSLQCLHFNFNSKIIYLDDAIFLNFPVYLAIAKENDGKSYAMQVAKFECLIMTCNDIYAAVVRTFLCFNGRFLLAILVDYSVLVWDTSTRGGSPVCSLQGRTSAKITDACLSVREDFLILSDSENCFHMISLTWPPPESEKAISSNLKLKLNIHQSARPTHLFNIPNTQYQQRDSQVITSSDEVDGTVFSTGPLMPKASINSYSLSCASWCCCVCEESELVAVGYGKSEVLVWNCKKKMNLLNFSVLPNRQAQVSHLRFSPYNITLARKTYKLLLLVVSDCLSLWDISPFKSDNFVMSSNSKQKEPECISCVRAGFGRLAGLSVNSSFSKFTAFDEHKRYFLWEFWKE